MLRITPIYGSRWDAEGPSKLGACTLVEYAHVKVLVNAGLNSDYDFSDLPLHDCLLLTDSTLEHMGGIPKYHQQHPDTPMYATFPTVKMGQMTLYDHHSNVCLDGGTCPFSMEEMDRAFASLITIKYAQTLLLPPHKPQVAITAHRAGHVVGGAFYVLQRLQDETVVVVTATYHIAKELHLDSSTLLQHGSTPDVLVTHPGGPAMTTLSNLYTQKKLAPPLVTQSERQLVEHVLAVLRRDGNVLIPVDASGRVLELVLLLSQHWDRHRLQGTYNLVWLGSMVVNTLEFCRSQLEWMSTVLGNQFDSPGKGHPYALNGVQLCTSMGELEAVLANGNPTVVLSSGLSLDHGPARDLLVKWADNDNNAVIFTDSSQCHVRPWIRRQNHHQEATPPINLFTPAATTTTSASTSAVASMTTTTATTTIAGSTDATTVPTGAAATASAEPEETPDDDNQTNSISTRMMAAAIPETDVSEFTASYQLLRHWCLAQLEDREMEDSVWVDVLVPHRAPLAGSELKSFLEQEEAGRLYKRKQEEERAMLREVELAKGRLRLGEEDAKESVVAASKSSNLAAAAAAPRPKKKSRFDSSLFLKFSKPLHCELNSLFCSGANKVCIHVASFYLELTFFFSISQQ
jgi:cleavage and polyadenylation specificity factor subunit 2